MSVLALTSFAIICVLYLRTWRMHEIVVPDDRRPLRPPDVLPFGPGEQTVYDVRVNGIAAGMLKVQIRNADETWAGALELHYDFSSSPTVATLVDYRFEGRTIVESDTLRPVWTQMIKRKGEEQETLTTRFDDVSGMAFIQEIESGEQEAEHQEIYVDGALDTGAALLLVRATRVGAGGAREFHLLWEDDVYQVAVLAGEVVKVEVHAGSFETVAVDLVGTKLEDGVGSAADSDEKPARARIYLAAEGALPVKMEWDVTIGRASAELTEYSYPPSAGSTDSDKPEHLGEALLDLLSPFRAQTRALEHKQQRLPGLLQSFPQAGEQSLESSLPEVDHDGLLGLKGTICCDPARTFKQCQATFDILQIAPFPLVQQFPARLDRETTHGFAFIGARADLAYASHDSYLIEKPQQ
jgi:hypothetical protein